MSLLQREGQQMVLLWRTGAGDRDGFKRPLRHTALLHAHRMIGSHGQGPREAQGRIPRQLAK